MNKIKNLGFTVIELLICISIVGIIVAVIFGDRESPNITCIDSVKFAHVGNGNLQQIISPGGTGVSCNEVK